MMELFIEESELGRTTTVYGYEKQFDRDIIYGFDGQNLVATALAENEAIPVGTPFLLKMHTLKFRDFAKAMADYASRKDIRTENENLLKGKLEATEAHLQTVKVLNDVQTELFRKIIDKFPRAK